ncbi:hypothetical protein [Leifsonia aquatica]|uniref:hypothetical protein n=1 Tax=Leifsonia aquatica TaxID=144185 RepID=UPI003815126E
MNDEILVRRDGEMLRRIECGSNPFYEMVAWPAANVMAIGAGVEVQFVDQDTADVVSRIALDGQDQLQDWFGHFGEHPGNALYVLGWRNVVCINWRLEVEWVSKNVAVDGILWVGTSDGRILLSAEMGPPGGWVPVELDALTGDLFSRG